MEETTTETTVDTGVAEQSTTTTTTDESAISETNESANSQENNSSVVGNTTDKELISFAKGQGIEDLSSLTDREVSLLKLARDTKSAYGREKQKSLDAESKVLSSPQEDASEVQRLALKVQHLEFEKAKNDFFSDKDISLEPIMAGILSDKRKQFGDDYARTLLSDLPGLYAMATAVSNVSDEAVIEQVRKDTISSINKSLTASSADAHAIDKTPHITEITQEWIDKVYDPSNPEHRKIVDMATKQVL